MQVRPEDTRLDEDAESSQATGATEDKDRRELQPIGQGKPGKGPAQNKKQGHYNSHEPQVEETSG